MAPPEPVLLLHSSASSSRQWRRLEQHIGGRYRMVAIDLLGYGEAPFPRPSGEFRLEQELALVEQAAGRLPGRVHLVGHSYGGAVACKFALRHPERVLSLYAHEPVLFALLAGRLPAEWLEIHNLSEQVRLHMQAGRSEHAAEIFLDYWSGPGTWKGLAAQRRLKLAAAVPKLVLDFTALLADGDPLAAYRGLPRHVLVTCGSLGPSAGRGVAHLLAEVLPSESVRQVDGVGHMAPLTHPEMVNAWIAAHLAAAPRTLRSRSAG